MLRFEASSMGLVIQGNREPVNILGEELERVTNFKYLGTSMEDEGGMETEITKRVGASWRNWKKCSGVLCDRRMPVKLKGNVYKTVIRPAMLYGAETWATTKRQEKQISGSAHPRTDKMLLTEAGQSNGKFCPRSNWKHYLD